MGVYTGIHWYSYMGTHSYTVPNQTDFSITGSYITHHSYRAKKSSYLDCSHKAGTRFHSSRSNVQKAVAGLVARGA